MNTIYWVFGKGEELGIGQMSARAFVTFLICLLLIRLGGIRIINKRSAFDTIIIIAMGSVLARGIVGASPYWATVAASAVMILVNRIVAWWAQASGKFGQLVAGKPLLLYDNGTVLWNNMRRAALSRTDLLESLRLETKSEDLSRVQRVYIETNGRISFILKIE
ncbi:hypothetical protein A8C56_13795 [Niabella ginsenosidivorans]|uniref:YetF C-terminal domain-containing protein n=1 Tax=Niabella ginsenosidivorans TaxID=1176587 RepID=A0A1A9I5T7_9BACT|nr:YetF domain-containing protein [Niabella ginsenosidivorans]ANH81904.1 hypothetical protein A8C56_13795 [Niabella ginsenosidivorans]